MNQDFHISNNHIEVLTNFFTSEDFPVPQGFTDKDVNVNAKLLFSDSFFLYSRSDTKKLFHDCIMQTVALDQKVTEVIQSKCF
ncbi:DUF3231 family protein [Paenibacillus sp. 2RAB27]|uniref:DUF3231 family protein n=1 Tax=Paenibacillus sp. 2RAB27 TaxID=3232991 RepID=UPI003F956812